MCDLYSFNVIVLFCFFVFVFSCFLFLFSFEHNKIHQRKETENDIIVHMPSFGGDSSFSVLRQLIRARILATCLYVRMYMPMYSNYACISRWVQNFLWTSLPWQQMDYSHMLFRWFQNKHLCKIIAHKWLVQVILFSCKIITCRIINPPPHVGLSPTFL